MKFSDAATGYRNNLVPDASCIPRVLNIHVK